MPDDSLYAIPAELFILSLERTQLLKSSNLKSVALSSKVTVWAPNCKTHVCRPLRAFALDSFIRTRHYISTVSDIVVDIRYGAV